jgi:hypothetical protein
MAEQPVLRSCLKAIEARLTGVISDDGVDS